jgi:hypothetical protein
MVGSISSGTWLVAILHIPSALHFSAPVLIDETEKYVKFIAQAPWRNMLAFVKVTPCLPISGKEPVLQTGSNWS